ncbi:MAG: amino acid transporter [Pedosphaera sp.]|nr:amino acid transporter [Pedosphaera sp.]
MSASGVHRPRNLDWQRAAALLYGDWGTSKAYVIGLAFLVAGYSSLPIIVAVCALTGLVAYNYIVICKHFPDGGGVYSAARKQSRLLAVMGALLLVANFTVTATLSGWAAMNYFGLDGAVVRWATIATIFGVGAVNYFGPKHTGSFAAVLALPMVVAVVAIVAMSVPYLSTVNLEASHDSFGKNWVAFVGVILALSGVEAIANLTGVMKLDPGATMEAPRVAQTARKSIIPVAIEVVVGTVLLGWAMLSLPHTLQPAMKTDWEKMVRFLAEQYGAMTFGPDFGHYFAVAVGIVVGLLLLSAVNTAIGALIGLNYMLARDGEMPRSFTRLNSHGVPWIPLAIAALLPALVGLFSTDLESLAGLYAIGVVGAIAVNLGSCLFNKQLPLKWYERAVMGVTFITLFAVELTIAKTKGDALFFACCVLGVGLTLRGYSQRRAGLRTVTVAEHVAASVSPEVALDFRINLDPGQSILVCARGLTPVLRFALEEARFRQGALYILYVKELAVTLPGPLESTERVRWQDDPEAANIMTTMMELGRQNDVQVIPLYSVSENPAATILDLSATLGIDILMLGARHRRTLAQMFKGDVANQVAKELPENIQLVIHG